MTTPHADDLARLAKWDTPTICNALDIVLPERRGHGFTVKPFSCLFPEMPPIVGYARTATIRAASPDLSDGKDVVDRLAYYEYMADGLQPTIVVVQDLDPVPGIGAWWGEVHTAVHKGLGALGVVTNGAYRDIADCAAGFQALGGMIAPSHAFVHPVAVGSAVSIHGMDVSHNDILHADRHGAVVIPAHVVGLIPEAVEQVNKLEAEILQAARSPEFNIDALRKALIAAQVIQ